MRREHELRHGRCQPLAQPSTAHNFTGDVRNPQPKLLAVRCELVGHDSHERVSSARRGILWHLQLWSYQRERVAKVWRVASLADRFAATVAIDNADFSSRQPDAHRIQYVGADGYRAAD